MSMSYEAAIQEKYASEYAFEVWYVNLTLKQQVLYRLTGKTSLRDFFKKNASSSTVIYHDNTIPF